jgi:hypothetical protein
MRGDGMSTIFETIDLLLAWSTGSSKTFTMRVAKVFREERKRLFNEDKQAYLYRVMDDHVMNSAELAKLLGYRSRSVINAIKNGSISLEKFDLLLGTLGGKVYWPPASERTALAMMATVTYVRKEGVSQTIREPLDREGFECLEQVIYGNKELCELQSDNEEDAWIDELTKQVKKIVPVNRKLDVPTMSRILTEWGPAYVRTQDALFGLVHHVTKR